MAKKGQTIHTGEIIKCIGERQTPKQERVVTHIMVSTIEDPKVFADGKELGQIETVFPNEDEDDMRVVLEFHFYATVIKAVKYRTKEPNKRQTIYINYQ